VSGQNRVPMADLRASMAAAGNCDVQTYLQSGNIVFDAGPDAGPDPDAEADADAGAGRQAAAAQGLATAVHQLIEREFGCDVKVLVLTAAELAQVAVANPFVPAAGATLDEKRLYATFLEEPVPEADFAGLTLPAQPGEQAMLAADGRVIYLNLPHGYGRTKLNNGYFERHLGVAATTRNWRTVLALANMSAK
jgi:uncharacterized protein (DUF1697 family)